MIRANPREEAIPSGSFHEGPGQADDPQTGAVGCLVQSALPIRFPNAVFRCTSGNESTRLRLARSSGGILLPTGEEGVEKTWHQSMR